MTATLGIYAGHDAAAALVLDDHLVVAMEEERFTRQKHHLGYPAQAVNAILAEYKPDKVIVATPWLQNLPPHLQVDHYLEHHQAHASYAYRISGFEQAKVLIVDGGGDQYWAAVYQADQGSLVLQNSSPMGVGVPLGMIYAYVTEALGFRQLHDEGKVMGLSAQGDPEQYKGWFDGLYSIAKNGALVSDVDHLAFQILQGKARQGQREDVAAALQLFFETIILAWVKANVTPDEDLCVAGGVFANVKINGLLLPHCRHLFVAPAMNDGGLAAGAALSFVPWIKTMQHNTCLGTDLGVPTISPDEVASRLQQQQFVGVACGKMEYGPRALGNRTILAAVTDKNTSDRLNTCLNRNEFMPFAPVILEAYASDVLAGYHGLTRQPSARHMTLVYHVRPEWQAQLAAVVHLDGTVRPQIVTPADGWYYQVVKAYHERTGIPALINTSFNYHGEPIVRTAEEARQTAKKCQLDLLVEGT